jgi:hypothetical protein
VIHDWPAFSFPRPGAILINTTGIDGPPGPLPCPYNHRHPRHAAGT